MCAQLSFQAKQLMSRSLRKLPTHRSDKGSQTGNKRMLYHRNKKTHCFDFIDPIISNAMSANKYSKRDEAFD